MDGFDPRSEDDGELRELLERRLDRGRLLKLAAGAGGAVAASAAGAGGAAAATRLASARAPKPRGTFTFLAAQELDATDWNPFKNTNLSNDILNPQIYDYLVNRDKAGRLTPGLATKWRNVNPREWEFDLRRGVTFHDGTPFTATDVKASLEYGSSPKAATSFFWGGVTPEVEIVNPYRVRVHTSIPYGGLITGTMSGGKGDIIVSHKDIGANKLSKKINGTGPFRFVGYEGEQKGVHMVANPRYWKGAPGVATFYFRAVSDSNVRLAALLAGQVDVIERVEPDQAVFLQHNNKVSIQRANSVENKWLAFRTTKPPFDNKKLRQAVCYAIDTETIVNKIMRGSGAVLKSYLTEAQDYYAPYSGYFRYDPAKAKKLLAEAGYPGGKGLPQIEYITSIGFYPKTKEYGEFIVQNLRNIGLNVKLTVMEEAAWYNALFQPSQGHMVDHGWFVAMTDPQVILYSLFGQQVIVQGKSPKLTAAIAAQTAAIDAKQRARILHEKVVPMLVDEAIEFPVFTSQLITAVRKGVNGFNMPAIDEFRAWYVTV